MMNAPEILPGMSNIPESLLGDEYAVTGKAGTQAVHFVMHPNTKYGGDQHDRACAIGLPGVEAEKMGALADRVMAQADGEVRKERRKRSDDASPFYSSTIALALYDPKTMRLWPRGRGDSLICLFVSDGEKAIPVYLLKPNLHNCLGMSAETDPGRAIDAPPARGTITLENADYKTPDPIPLEPLAQKVAKKYGLDDTKPLTLSLMICSDGIPNAPVEVDADGNIAQNFARAGREQASVTDNQAIIFLEDLKKGSGMPILACVCDGMGELGGYAAQAGIKGVEEAARDYLREKQAPHAAPDTYLTADVVSRKTGGKPR